MSFPKNIVRSFSLIDDIFNLIKGKSKNNKERKLKNILKQVHIIYFEAVPLYIFNDFSTLCNFGASTTGTNALMCKVNFYRTKVS